MKKILFIFLISCFASTLIAQDLRAKLEASYKAFTDAIKAKDGEKLKATLSSYAYMNMKNQMSSSGAKFPDDFFEFAPKMLQNPATLKFRKAVKNGPTAFCIYSGKDKYGDTSMFVYKFIEENSVWKFNFQEERSNDVLKTLIKAGNYSFLETNDRFKPDGIVPATPSEIVPGDYKAMLDIMGYGYEVQVTVNGNVQHIMNGGSYSGVIMGGIKKGKNKIVITVKPVKGEEPGTFSVGIRAQIKDQEKDVFNLEEKTPGATITKEFVVQ
jgi:hypothetical protein